MVALKLLSNLIFFHISAIDRSITSSLSDARDALTNAVVDLVSAYKSNVSNLQQSGLVVPASMRLFPVYILALLKQVTLPAHTVHSSHTLTPNKYYTS